MNRCQKSLIFERFRKLRFQKKAQLSFNLTDWLPKILLLVAVFVLTVFIVESFYRFDLSVESIRTEILAYRIYNSDVINYYDEDINRLYVGTIDKEKFETADFSQFTYGKDVKYYGAKLILAADNKESPPEFYNEDEYNEWMPLTFDKSRYFVLNKEYYVLIKDKDNIYPGKLKIEVVTPNG